MTHQNLHSRNSDLVSSRNLIPRAHNLFDTLFPEGFFSDQFLNIFNFNDFKKSNEFDSLVLPNSYETIRDNADLVIRIDLPGVKDEDIEVTLEDNKLFIKGERKERVESKDKDNRIYSRTVTYGSFSKVIDLPKFVQSEDIHGSLNDGVLEVRISNAFQEESSKKISINIIEKSSEKEIEEDKANTES